MTSVETTSRFVQFQYLIIEAPELSSFSKRRQQLKFHATRLEYFGCWSPVSLLQLTRTPVSAFCTYNKGEKALTAAIRTSGKFLEQRRLNGL